MPERLLCALEELPAPRGCKGIRLEAPRPLELLLVRDGDALYGYHNSCPHTGIPLDWQEDHFLDYTNTYIQCATHGALFTLDGGYCVHGPCVGRSLRPVALRVRAGLILGEFEDHGP